MKKRLEEMERSWESGGVLREIDNGFQRTLEKHRFFSKEVDKTHINKQIYMEDCQRGGVGRRQVKIFQR